MDVAMSIGISADGAIRGHHQHVTTSCDQLLPKITELCELELKQSQYRQQAMPVERNQHHHGTQDKKLYRIYIPNSDCI